MIKQFNPANNAKDAAIKKSRMATATLSLRGRDKQLLANQEVVLSQCKHKFLFGCASFESIPLINGKLEGAAKVQAEQFSKKILELFNFITLPFYWGGFEAKRDQPKTREMQNAARWFTERGCRVKGHPLCWHSVSPKWLLELSNTEIIHKQLARIRREVADFRGLIDTWDVINEVVIMPVFEKYDNGITRMARELGRFGIIRKVFQEARSINQEATLLLNDFDLSTAYEILIEGCLDAGIKIDAIGIQSHMHQGYWGMEKTQKILERFAKFGLPLHFTETTLLSGHLMPPDIVDLNDYKMEQWPSTPEAEERQKREAVEFYRTLVAHPAVEAITWWGLSDGGWLNAPSGLLRSDHSPKPVYEALHALVKGEWWLAPATMVTDKEGKLRFEGFTGEYKVAWKNTEKTFNLENSGAVTSELEF